MFSLTCFLYDLVPSVAFPVYQHHFSFTEVCAEEAFKEKSNATSEFSLFFALLPIHVTSGPLPLQAVASKPSLSSNQVPLKKIIFDDCLSWGDCMVWCTVATEWVKHSQ